MQTVTPLDTAARALQEASPEALLDSIVQLTHRIHGLTSGAATQAAMVRAAELRQQRGMLRGEVLRRIGGDR